MIDNLRKLLNVQDKDVEILKIEEQKIILPRMLDQLRSTVEGKNKEVDAARSVLREIQMGHKRLEIELEGKETTRKKYEVQLMTVKTNQEYKALEKEIFGLKTDTSRLEDGILEKLMSIDTQNEVIKKLEVELKNLKNQYEQKELEVKNKIQELDARLSQLKGERENLAKEVDPELFRRYSRILNHVRGKAIVPIIDLNCQGCHTLLHPQVFVDIRKGQELVACENCARLLYVPEDSKSSENPDSSVDASVKPV